LVIDKLGEICVGEHATRALRAVADDDVAERAGRDVAVERLDRAGELRCGFSWRAQAVRWADAAPALRRRSEGVEDLGPGGDRHVGEKSPNRARASGADWHRK